MTQQQNGHRDQRNQRFQRQPGVQPVVHQPRVVTQPVPAELRRQSQSDGVLQIGSDRFPKEDGDGETSAAPAIEEYTAESYMTGTMIPLPSGKWIRIRPYSLMSALNRGELPNILIGPAKELLYNDKGVANFKKESKAPKEDDHKEGELFDFLCCQMIASFSCVDRPQEECGHGEVSVHHILECDKIAIVRYCTQGQEALSSFRQIS